MTLQATLQLCLAKTPSGSNIGRYSLVLTVKSGPGFVQMAFGEAQLQTRSQLLFAFHWQCCVCWKHN